MQSSVVHDKHKKLRETVAKILDAKQSIKLNSIENVSEAINVIEGLMDERKLHYRLRTDKIATAAAAATGTGIVGGAVLGAVAEITLAPLAVAAAAAAPFLITAGVVGAVGIAAHRIFTHSPDYEIIRFAFSNEIHVMYQK